MRSILIATVAVLSLALPVHAQSLPTTEAACKADKGTWKDDFCYSGRRCTLKNGGSGYDAVNSKGQRGCNPVGPEEKTVSTDPAKPLPPVANTKPAEAKADDKGPADEATCTGLKLTWEKDRCYSGHSCKLRSGATGFDAWLNGQRGCSAWGPSLAIATPRS